MPEQSLKSVLERLGLKQSEFARLLDVSARTVSLWATGAAALPGPVSAYLRILQASGPDVLSQELRSVVRRNKMLDEGLYSLSYCGKEGRPRDSDEALAVLRNGKILGSDRGGGVFSGSYEFDPILEKNRVHVRLSVPPDGTLVTGYAAGREGAVLDINGAFERAAPVSNLVVEAAGQPITVQLTYLSPLPN